MENETNETMTLRLNLRIPKRTHRAIKSHCAKIGKNNKDWFLDAIVAAYESEIVNGDLKPPDPLSTQPIIGTIVFVACPLSSDSYLIGYVTQEWLDDEAHQQWLKKGLVHLSKGNAIKHAERMIAQSKHIGVSDGTNS